MFLLWLLIVVFFVAIVAMVVGSLLRGVWAIVRRGLSPAS